MKISDRRLRISDSLKISDFSNSLGVLQHPKHPQQYAYDDDDYCNNDILASKLVSFLVTGKKCRSFFSDCQCIRAAFLP